MFGGQLKDRGEFERGQDCFEEALTIYGTLQSEEPGEVLWRRGEATAYLGLGKLKFRQLELEDASSHLKRAVDIWKPISDESPEDNRVKQKLAGGLQVLGVCRHRQKDAELALAAFTESIELWEQVQKEEPGNAPVQTGFADALNNFSAFLLERGDHKEARLVTKKAIEIRKFLSRRDPTNASWLYHLALVTQNLGVLEAKGEDIHASAVAYDEALVVWSQLRELADPLLRWRENWAKGVGSAETTYGELWDSAYANGNEKEALQFARKFWMLSLEFWEELPSASERRYHVARRALDLSTTYNHFGDLTRANYYFEIARYLLQTLIYTGLTSEPEEVEKELSRVEELSKAFPEGDPGELKLPSSEVLKRCPELPIFVRAEILAAWGTDDQAQTLLTTVRKETPDILSQRAGILAKKGQVPEALDLLQQAIEESESKSRFRQRDNALRIYYELSHLKLGRATCRKIYLPR